MAKKRAKRYRVTIEYVVPSTMCPTIKGERSYFTVGTVKEFGPLKDVEIGVTSVKVEGVK